MQSPPELDEQHEVIDVQFIETLSTKMLKKQPLFNQTGSAHASGLFNYSGELIVVYEDIGRHNALDKLVGHCLEKSQDQLKQSVLLVSGRASFELVQKAIRASIPIMLSVGAPSSLAVETAKRFNLTLIGFIKANRFNVYHAPWRIKFG